MYVKYFLQNLHSEVTCKWKPAMTDDFNKQGYKKTDAKGPISVEMFALQKKLSFSTSPFYL